MRTLHLTLKKHWFDMIYAGIKKEEYRTIKPYWGKRLCGNLIYRGHRNGLLPNELKTNLSDFYPTSFKSFDTITFKNGYASDAPEMVVEFKGIEIKEGNPEWGAVPGTKYFTITLGELLSTKNMKPF